MFYDFEKIRNEVALSQAAHMLGLGLTKHGQQMRGPCPICKRGGDRTLVITEGRGFYCFAKQAGGDVIALVAHIKNCNVKEAAKFLQAIPDSVPQKEDQNREALEPLPYLEHDHQAVAAIGFDTEVAKRLGVGYAPKGIMRGTVAVPIRDEHGTLVAYIGIEEARLPADLMGKIVPLKRA